MTIIEIYHQFQPGSTGFVQAVQSHCGFCISRTEIKRIADLAADADEFQRIWGNDDSWTDENNVSDDAA